MFAKIRNLISAARCRRAHAHAEQQLRAREDLWMWLERCENESRSTGCSYIDYWTFYSTVRQMKPTEVLECGTGISTVVLAAALRDNHLDGGPRGRLTSMEDQQDWYDQAKRLCPDELGEYIDYTLSPQVIVRESIFTGVGYRDVPKRDYELVFVDGPHDRLSPPGTPTVDMDFLDVVRRSSRPVLGIVDKRWVTCFVYQALLGSKCIKFDPVSELSFVGPCTARDIEARPLNGAGKAKTWPRVQYGQPRRALFHTM